MYTGTNAAEITLNEYHEANAGYGHWTKRVERKYKNVYLYDPEPFLCSDKCRGVTDGEALYFDSPHLTEGAARRLAPIAERIFARD